jgi:hypothetical protein
MLAEDGTEGRCLLRAEFVQRDSYEWPLLWDHLQRVYPDSDLNDNFGGESWEYMGTYFSGEHVTHDNKGVPVPRGEMSPCWNHQFRHRNYKGWGRMYVNIVADFESIPHAVEAAELGVEL